MTDKKRKIPTNITYRGYLLGDFDNDGIKNIDDKFPLRKNPKDQIEETNLSTVVKNAYRLTDITKENERKILKGFRETIKEIHPKIKQPMLYRSTPHRTKLPISTINKAWQRGVPTIKDLIGVSYLAKNRMDAERTAKKLLQKYPIAFTKEESVRNYYRKPSDGYKAIHLYVKDPKTMQQFEIQIKTRRMYRLSFMAHLSYKENNQDRTQMLKLMDLAIKADEGDIQAQKEFDKLTDEEITTQVTKRNKKNGN